LGDFLNPLCFINFADLIPIFLVQPSSSTSLFRLDEANPESPGLTTQVALALAAAW
jgi:hypothetical protein